MKMADDHSGGIRLPTETESKNVQLDEEKILSVPYNHQLTILSAAEPQAEDVTEPEKNTDAEESVSNILQKRSSVIDSSVGPQSETTESKELCDVPTFNYDRMPNVSVVKRTRGRPRKDCQRPVKHHLGQSVPSKV